MSGLRRVTAGGQSGVKVYNVAGGKTLPEWLSEKKKASLRKDEEFRRRMELIQELDFPVSSSRVKLSADGNFLVVTGIHPPQVKVYELSQLALKFERHLLSEVVDFQILTDDYSKLLFACADRSLVLHAKFGGYFSTRLPRVPRAVAFRAASATAFAAASAPELYRLSLELGRFLTPLHTSSPGLNIVRVAPSHGLVAAGGDDGALECFDERSPVTASRLEAASGGGGGGVTALRFDEAGTSLALGTQSGKVLLYDLRSSRPLHSKDHMYGLPMLDVKWHVGPEGTRRVASADARTVKLWDAVTGAPFTSFEPEADITDVCLWPGSGLLLLATEAKRLVPAFIPALGPAPRWCAFLENLTEEMEEAETATLYDDFRFVTRAELDRVGLGAAVGTPVLRPYMHGYFIDNKLFGRAASLLQPFDYASYRQRKIDEKLEAERGSRIGMQRRLPRVNAALAQRLAAPGRRRGAEAGSDEEEGGDDYGDDLAVAAEEEEGQDAAAEAAAEAAADKPAASLLRDPRFQALFSNADFEIDEGAAEYKHLHPHARAGGAAEGEGEPSFFVARGDLPAFGGLGGAGLAERAQPLGERRDGKRGREEGGRGRGRGRGRGGGRGGGGGGGGRGGGGGGRGRGRGR